VAVDGRANLSASGCLPEAIGAAWLRPWLPSRRQSASKHSSKAAVRVCQSPLQAGFHRMLLKQGRYGLA